MCEAPWIDKSLQSITLAIKDGTHGSFQRVREGVPLLSAKNIAESGQVTWGEADDRVSDEDYLAITRAFGPQTDDILITIVGTLGRRAVFNGERVAFQRSVAFVRPNKALVLPRFLYHAVGTPKFIRQLVVRSNATAQAGLYLGELSQTTIPVPPDLVEQRRIAATIDLIDGAIERMVALTAKLKQVRTGLLNDLLAYGLDERGKIRDPITHPEHFKESVVGRIPIAWDVVPLGSLFQMQLGKMLSPRAKAGNFARPYVTNRHILWEKVDCSDLEWMDFSPAERLKYSLRYGDLLVCEGGEVGRTAIWKEEMAECYFQKAIHRLRPIGDLILPEYMLSFMRRAAARGAFVNLTSQTSIAHLTQEKLAQLQVVRPPKGEQQLIVARLLVIDTEQKKHDSILAKLANIKFGLTADLLSGRVRVPELSLVSEEYV